MKRNVAIFLFLLLALPLKLSSQSIQCTTSNSIIKIDTIQFLVVTAFNPSTPNDIDTVFWMEKEYSILNVHCSDSMVSYLYQPVGNKLIDFGFESIRKNEGTWKLHYGTFFSNDFEMVGLLIDDKRYITKYTPIQLLETGSIKYRVESILGNGMDKQVWEYVRKFDLQNLQNNFLNAPNILSSTRIE